MKKLLSLAMVLALMLSLGVTAFAAPSLRDVNPGNWYYNEVSEMVYSGAIEGYEDGTFKPNQKVTVVEAVTMAARMVDAPTGKNETHWGGVQMEHAYSSGWIDETDVAKNDTRSRVPRARLQDYRLRPRAQGRGGRAARLCRRGLRGRGLSGQRACDVLQRPALGL